MMHDEPDFLKDCVVSEVSDDYENFEIVLKSTKRLAASKGIKVGENEVVDALQRAISEGLISAYTLSPVLHTQRELNTAQINFMRFGIM